MRSNFLGSVLPAASVLERILCNLSDLKYGRYDRSRPCSRFGRRKKPAVTCPYVETGHRDTYDGNGERPNPSGPYTEVERFQLRTTHLFTEGGVVIVRFFEPMSGASIRRRLTV
jgi:hypothetical protein